MLVTLCLGVAISGCGGDNEPEASASASASPETTAAGSSRTERPSTSAAPDSLEGLSATYLDGVDGKVTYRYVSNFGQKPDGVWTLNNLGDNRRQEWFTEVSGFPATTTAIVVEGDDYLCTGTPFSIQCRIEPEETVSSALPYFIPVTEIPEAVLDGIDGLVETPLPDETIIGLEAKCFDLEIPGRIGVGPAGSEQIKICFSEEGYLLYMKRTVVFDDTTIPVAEVNLDAQEIADSKEADFEPPAPPSN